MCIRDRDYVTSVNGDLGAHVKFDSYMLHQDDLELGSYRLLEVDRRVVLPTVSYTHLLMKFRVG